VTPGPTRRTVPAVQNSSGWSSPEGLAEARPLPAGRPRPSSPILHQPQLTESLAAFTAALPARRHLCVAGPVGCGQGLFARLLRDRIDPAAPLVKLTPADLLESSTAAALRTLRGFFDAASGGVLYLAELESLYSDQNAVPLLTTLRECLRDYHDVSMVLTGDLDAVSRVHALNPELFARFVHVEVRSFTTEQLLDLVEYLFTQNNVEMHPGFRVDAVGVLRRIRSVGSMRNARIAGSLAAIAVEQSAGKPVLLSDLDITRLRPLGGLDASGLQDLEELIGLSGVKSTVRLWMANSAVTARREQLGLQTGGMAQHMVFKGPAGTAKTTVARIVGRVLTETGVLSSGHLVEVQRADLVGDTLEQSARRTVEVVKRSLGGVLFIDEAYTLTSDGAGRDSGKEIVDTLLKMMEDYREEFVVIAAGYPLEMEQFLNSNPGLRSRFSRVLEFPAYSSEELLRILDFLAAKRGYRVDTEVHLALESRLALVSQYPGFGNGRHVRNLLESAIVRQAFRVTADSSDDDLRTLLLDDFLDPAAAQGT
jgi:AAA+ superfamily predicted ATPase